MDYYCALIYVSTTFNLGLSSRKEKVYLRIAGYRDGRVDVVHIGFVLIVLNCLPSDSKKKHDTKTILKHIGRVFEALTNGSYDH